MNVDFSFCLIFIKELNFSWTELIFNGNTSFCQSIWHGFFWCMGKYYTYQDTHLWRCVKCYTLLYFWILPKYFWFCWQMVGQPLYQYLWQMYILTFLLWYHCLGALQDNFLLATNKHQDLWCWHLCAILIASWGYSMWALVHLKFLSSSMWWLVDVQVPN